MRFPSVKLAMLVLPLLAATALAATPVKHPLQVLCTDSKAPGAECYVRQGEEPVVRIAGENLAEILKRNVLQDIPAVYIDRTGRAQVIFLQSAGLQRFAFDFTSPFVSPRLSAEPWWNTFRASLDDPFWRAFETSVLAKFTEFWEPSAQTTLAELAEYELPADNENDARFTAKQVRADYEAAFGALAPFVAVEAEPGKASGQPPAGEDLEKIFIKLEEESQASSPTK